MTITQQQITAAQQDADAFGTVPKFDRLVFIEKLLAEDVNTLFNARIVRYLLDALKEANDRGTAYKGECLDMQDRLVEAVAAAKKPVPKGKVAVKLARIVAKQADALNDIVNTVDADQSGYPEWEALKEKHQDVIEAANYGD